MRRSVALSIAFAVLALFAGEAWSEDHEGRLLGPVKPQATGSVSAECKSCLAKCDANFPRGGGPLQSCKATCQRAGSCPARLPR
jgi:hypothetical protein